MMAWLVALVLIIFYLLGVYVFHAGGGIHVLPVIAVAVVIIDFVFYRRLRGRRR